MYPLNKSKTNVAIARNLFPVLSTFVCLLYTSDAADDTPCVDLGGRRIIKKNLLDKAKITPR